MDLKTVELEILKINEDFITFLDKVNQEADDRVEALLRDLNLKVDDKSTFVKSLESNLIKADEVFKSKIREFASQLDNLTKNNKELKYDLEEAAVELEKQKTEELKPFLLQQKKKRTELTHKITAQKKELGFLHKDNNSKLIEEEKNYKNREVELARRMGIDLDRLNEANVKQYSDIEKSILELEDVKLIKEAQKQINSIRLVGIKENLAIKNKYALQNYENSLDFKRFQEKIVLDNSILTEEFKQRVKTLEYEKELLEDEEALKLLNKDFDNELKLKEFERENELDQCDFEKENASNINNVNKDVLNTKKDEHKYLYESVDKVYIEVYNFDKVQLTEFIMGDNNLLAADKKVTETLISYLRNYILSYKELLITSAEDYSNRRKYILNSFINLLCSSKFEEIYNCNSNYQDLIKEISPALEEYLNLVNNSFTKFTNIVKALMKNLEENLNLTMITLKNYWQENDMIHNAFFNHVSKQLDDSYKNRDLKLKNLHNSNDTKVTNTANQQNSEYNSILEEIKEKTNKIVNDYNIKKKDILLKIENYKKDLNLKQDKDKRDLSKYIKQSKLKISNFKKVYAENIANHEKVEHDIYKEVIKQNKIEYKNRLESINTK